MGTVEFFGVRHHSPAAARLLAERLRQQPPACVLVEGPSEFNDHLDELVLPHELPIMIYSWAPLHPDADPGSPEAAARRAAYYPLCDYSPEWVALRTAHELGVPCRFIDLPWFSLVDLARSENRFAEPEPGPDRRPPMEALFEAFGVDSLDLLVDELVEIDPAVDQEAFQQRMGMLGSLLRGVPDAETRAREDFMGARLRESVARTDGVVLVVCGAAHVDGLREQLTSAGPPPQPWHPPADDDRYGIALTPTSYAALDALDGYDAGQPNPGFYDALFRGATVESLLAEIVAHLRQQHQHLSPADLIAVLTTARALADLRGHQRLWRTDLVDAITSTLVKDDSGANHPLLAHTRLVLRGDRLGRLAEGTRRPPLVVELTTALEALGLVPTSEQRREAADLTTAEGLRRSRLLHSLLALGIPIGGLTRTADQDGIEQWTLHWTPEYEGQLVAAARWGGDREGAVTACLLDEATSITGDPRAAASLMLKAALCGINHLSSQLQERTETILGTTGDLPGLGEALTLLMRLFRYDPLLRTTGRTDLGRLVTLGFDQALRLAERLGRQADGPGLAGLVNTIKAVTDVVERCSDTLDLDVNGWDAVLGVIVADPDQAAELRGAALGGRWLTGALPDADLAAGVALETRAEHLGGFVAGLLSVAREAALRRPDLVMALDERITAFDEDEFLVALPALRRAFSRHAPRERSQVAHVLLGEHAPEALQSFSGSTADALAIASFEAAVASTIHRFLGDSALDDPVPDKGAGS